MKTLKFLLLFSFVSCCDSNEKVEEIWNNLKKSNTEQTEIKRIEELSREITRLKASYSLYEITNSNDTLNLIVNKLDSVKLNHINIKIHWVSDEFYGKNWKPINKKNIYLIFKEYKTNKIEK